VIHFRSFRTRLLVLILALTALAQFAALLVVDRLHNADARREIAHQLDVAAQQFYGVINQRNADLARSSEALSFDAGLRQSLVATRDRATLRSALDSFRSRIGANLVALLSLTGTTLAETRDGPSGDAVYLALQRAADAAENARATAYGFIDGRLYSITVVPLRAPDIVAWIAIGFPLDQSFVDELKATTDVEITLQHGATTLASTVRQPADYLTVTRDLPAAGGDSARLVLQYSLDEKRAPVRRLERVLVAVGTGSLVLAALIALWVARSVSQPVRELAEHTKIIAAGDYSRRIELHREDELGRLAAAFNAMSTGLAERDRVRDLLDKNVSPAVAAQLLRDGAALGGEEREVTILFADLRGFTTLSEKLAPPDLLALLNRYLDRMSAEIERQGGVIDKYIGDAIMALFGAPLAQGDAADRALAAALAMTAALAQLNRELAAEASPFTVSLPNGLAIGVGINTARVVAGNIGSARRLNYSVIGDGVNVAARLQSLTRTPEYRTSIIVSAATLRAARGEYEARPLGDVAVKGRAEPVTVFALDGQASSPT
jgi:adenylate cyclase